MTTLATHLPTALLLTQAGDPAGSSSLLWLFAALAAAATVAAIIFGQRLATAQRRIKTLSVEHSSTAEAHRALLDKERKEAKDLDARREELRDLKRELQAQKKKNHEIQEELKKLRDEARQAKEETQRTRSARPAFAEPTKVPDKPKAEPPVAVAPPTPASVEPVLPARQPETFTNNELTTLMDKLAAQQDELDNEREEHRQARAELRQLRKRMESLRRIDLVSTGKIELLEDKLAQLGRQHYDVISQLALLKGEVQPVPPPQRRTRPPRPAPSAADEITDAEATQAREELAALADESADGAETIPPAEPPADNSLEHTS